MIRQYLNDITNDHQTQNEWEIQLTMEINVIFSKDSNETRTMHTKSDNIEIMVGNETDEIINKEKSMKRSEFVFDSVDLLYYKLHRINLNGGGSYIDSPKLLKNKKATILPKNNDDKCFQYVVTAA